MNAPVTPQAPYALSVYRSSAIPAQPPHRWPQDANRASPTRVSLRWGHYANLEPWQDVDTQLQPGMRPHLDGKSEDDLYINHKRWNFDNTSKWMILIPYIKWLSILLAPWLFWMFAVTGAFSKALDWVTSNYGLNISATIGAAIVFFSLGMIGVSGWLIGWYETPRYKYYLMHTGTGLATALLASLLTFHNAPYGTDLFWLCGAMALSVLMGLIGWDYLQNLYLRVFKHDGSGFNRQTGMVTIGRRFRQPFTAPFYEFDATLEFRPSPHGNSGFAIWLHHRYTWMEVFLGGKIQSLGMPLEEALAFWDTLQRYMDVTQPLPELPILEQFRHLDPNTVDHDQKHQREPRRWRDMPYRVWERRGRAEMLKRNRDYSWQDQSCILQAKIDPSLSIEAYYRSQEGKGIRATPKGDDYDNIHRG